MKVNKILSTRCLTLTTPMLCDDFYFDQLSMNFSNKDNFIASAAIQHTFYSTGCQSTGYNNNIKQTHTHSSDCCIKFRLNTFT